MNREIVGNVKDSDVVLVTADLLKRGVNTFTIRPGNGAVWVSHGRCDCYYVIRDEKIVDVIYD